MPLALRPRPRAGILHSMRRPLAVWMVVFPDVQVLDVTGPLEVFALANRALMSPRNFARVFRREIGVTPAAYVEAQRVEGARRLLETADRSVAGVARACGFGSAETMYHAFRRNVRVTPGQYRRHFRSAPRPARAS